MQRLLGQLLHTRSGETDVICRAQKGPRTTGLTMVGTSGWDPRRLAAFLFSRLYIGRPSVMGHHPSPGGGARKVPIVSLASMFVFFRIVWAIAPWAIMRPNTFPSMWAAGLPGNSCARWPIRSAGAGRLLPVRFHGPAVPSANGGRVWASQRSRRWLLMGNHVGRRLYVQRATVSGCGVFPTRTTRVFDG